MLMNRREVLEKVMMGLATLPVLSALTACGKKEEAAPVESAPAAPAEAAPAAPAEAAPAAPAEAAPAAGAENLIKLEESDPTAQALGYAHDASKVDVAKFPKKAGADGASQKCSNCSQFVAGGNEAGWGKCNIFPGKLVNAEGWCNTWLAKQG